MAKLKRRAPRVSVRSRGVSVDAVLTGCRADLVGLSPEELDERRALRHSVEEASIGTPFDPRRALTMTTEDLAAWTLEREAWARGLLARRRVR